MRVAAVLSFSVSSLLAQATILVGPGQTFTDLPAAVAAALPGDRVLVQAGGYSSCIVDKAILIRAEPLGALVVIAHTYGGSMRWQVPAGQMATVAGIEMQTPAAVELPTGQAVAGTVAFEDVRMTQGLLVADAHATLRGCDISNFGFGVQLVGAATLSAVQCAIRANFATFWPFVDGITASGTASVHLSGCTVTGGTAGFHQLAAIGNGVALSGNARGWFVDSTLEAYPFGPVLGFAPVGLANQSTQPATVERCVLRDHLGNSPASTGTVQNGLVLGLSSATPLARGAAFVLDYHSRPGLPVVAHAAFALGTPVSFPFVAQPDFGFAAAALPIAFAVADAQGNASVTLQLPNAAWLQDLGIWFSGWSELGLPVQLAPVLGGVVR
ncbi:MAG: hypothetical protein U1E73_00580 [Planctomycetota bacterium]